MAGLFAVKSASTRKRALVAESEVLRETLRLELRNVGLYSVTLRRRYSSLQALRPWLFLGAPVITFFRGRKRRRSGKLKMIGTALTLWRLYRRYGPLLKTVMPRLTAHRTGRETIMG